MACSLSYLLTKLTTCLPHLAYIIKLNACSPRHSNNRPYKCVSQKKWLVHQATCLPYHAYLIKLTSSSLSHQGSSQFRVLTNLEVETDTINVVSAVVENRELSMEGPILEDVKQLLAQLRGTGIHHVCRSANLVAHLLARFGFNFNCTNVWISETPTVVSNAVSIDAIT
ncbi:hypothetical protein TIFTF001_044780 [Ficus carica]|uniref:RNase H type-1 domain-containing protein n=1 Tax=Ficus carica TaxID=3494 RepID=A0AA87ZEM5_FICCA|nr:hypothetical protein TIFTF001_044780 [Ficus carica]